MTGLFADSDVVGGIVAGVERPQAGVERPQAAAGPASGASASAPFPDVIEE